MKKQLLLWSMLICIFIMGHAQATIDANGNIEFPDENFKKVLIDHTRPIIDTNKDKEISVEEAEVVTQILMPSRRVENLIGIEYFINLEWLNAINNDLQEVDLSENRLLKVLSLGLNKLKTIDLSQNILLETLWLEDNQFESVDLSSNELLVDLNLTDNELIGVIDVSNHLDLKTLNAGFNYGVTRVDVSQNSKLETLNLSYNFLVQKINLLGNSNLKRLVLNNNKLSEIDLSNNTELTYLNLSLSDITEIDLSNNTELQYLRLNNNEFLTEIDLSNQEDLWDLEVTNTNINVLDMSNCSIIRADFSNNSNLATVSLSGQSRISYDTVLGEEVLEIGLNNNPNLQFICVDQEYLNDIYSLLEDANQTSVQLSTDCSTVLNRIQGDVTYDLDNNGCGGDDDVAFTGGLRYSAISLSSGESYVTYPNDEGEYALDIADDIYFLGPALENFEYFGFSEPILQAPTVIPLQLPNLTTDYCIQPLGIFNDLEITITPISRAVPGFEATYQINYINRGTTTQSGAVTLDYDSDVLEYVSSTPSVTSDSNGQLTWNFQNLSPMETIEIPLSFILNTPTDSPALNGEDILNFTAIVAGATDETPDNNEMELAQRVVNSYDPNDKTCLEGDILDPDDVGKYLHYLIRFENEGTAEARNIRVTDVIDTTKFDIESFVPLKSSHPYTTTITNGSDIEFTFSDINLPFDDENNDGYVLFEIKTLDTLVEGDEIVNGAAIYFDYNFPVITENSVVEVKREVVSEPGFSDYFTLSPNPTTGIMNLTVLDDSITISYMLIYDMGGNLVGYYFGPTRTMNVSYLFPNSYIFKVITGKGEFSTQFIKL